MDPQEPWKARSTGTSASREQRAQTQTTRALSVQCSSGRKHPSSHYGVVLEVRYVLGAQTMWYAVAGLQLVGLVFMNMFGHVSGAVDGMVMRTREMKCLISQFPTPCFSPQTDV